MVHREDCAGGYFLLTARKLQLVEILFNYNSLKYSYIYLLSAVRARSLYTYIF